MKKARPGRDRELGRGVPFGPRDRTPKILTRARLAERAVELVD